MFNVAIVSADEAVEAGMAAQVTIGDSNTGDVLVSLDQAVYQGSEGDNVTVCLLVQAGGVTDITRSVVLRVSTQSDTAQGMKGGGGETSVTDIIGSVMLKVSTQMLKVCNVRFYLGEKFFLVHTFCAETLYMFVIGVRHKVGRSTVCYYFGVVCDIVFRMHDWFLH